jgi:zinc transporter 9
MDDLTYLGLLCVAMFLGAFGAGYLPLTIKMSESKLRLVTIFGAGLLVGTALVVVIPEGISMHYEGQLRHAAEEAAASLQEAGAVGTRLLMEAHDHAGEAVEGLLEGSMEEEDEVTHSHPGHWQIGAALAFGFAFQLVVDRMSGGLHGHAHGVVLPGGAAKDEHGCPASEASVVAAPGDNSAKSKSALVGMIVHAAVDGIALGAAVREGDSALSLLVFFAIMLHKAPSSFGLASYFLHHGITPAGVKKRLLVFSCAAPLGAFCTYMLLSMSLLPYKQVSGGGGVGEGGAWFLRCHCYHRIMSPHARTHSLTHSLP